MTFSIITKNKEKTFKDKELVNISSKEGYDFCVDFGFDYMIAVQYDEKNGKCTILNQFNCQNILFKGEPLPPTLEVEKTCRLIIKDSDNFIQIRVNDAGSGVKISREKFSEEDLKDFYGDKINASARYKLERRKAELEEARIAIIKQVNYSIGNLTHKLSMNSKTGVFLHVALFFASMLLAFGISGYFAGLELKNASNLINMPVNIRLLILFTIVIYAVGLVLKQGIFLMLQNKTNTYSATNAIGEKIMFTSSVVLYGGIYIINLLYYLAPGTIAFFAVFMALFFTFICVTLAVTCGYYKNNNIELSEELNKYQYREDFECVIKEYGQWIDRYINTISNSKIASIKDTLFNLRLKSGGEILLGILTAPFLAYGVSNTLAMCFPEAAAWIRISTFKFSPVFLTLASFMIIFAFFIFVHAFVTNRKIQASNVLKNDGFGNYMNHGVEIYGLQGIKRLEADMKRSFCLGLCVVFIEFTMNISYFMQEMGDDFSGTLLSFLSALVPTALLITESYMLSRVSFEIETADEVLSKIER